MKKRIEEFILILHEKEDWLIERILHYAIREGYSVFTSTLKELWRDSIVGLTNSIIEQVEISGFQLELSYESLNRNKIFTEFGEMEALRHRRRGVSLDMFLGLMKYYRQTYIDLLDDIYKIQRIKKKELIYFINRYFDHIEIASCKSWTSLDSDKMIIELQEENRTIVNEKNLYLTLFESFLIPVLIVDKDGEIEKMNYAASNLLSNSIIHNKEKYQQEKNILHFSSSFPWLIEDFNNFIVSDESKRFFDIENEKTKRFFTISFSKIQDISHKFLGTIVIISDITERKKLEIELAKMATTDPLTGAKNRRYFISILDKELQRHKRYGHQLAIIMIDLDHFKKINDKHGHDVGDKILKQLVESSIEIFRGTDHFARWGGEEFVALLPETNKDEAYTTCERFRKTIEEQKYYTADKKRVRTTVSIGVTIVEHHENNSIEHYFDRADKALYIAKASGRNRTQIEL